MASFFNSFSWAKVCFIWSRLVLSLPSTLFILCFRSWRVSGLKVISWNWNSFKAFFGRGGEDFARLCCYILYVNWTFVWSYSSICLTYWDSKGDFTDSESFFIP
jgi:hypothetical protein